MSDSADSEFKGNVTDIPRMKAPSDLFWRSVMVAALLFMPFQSVYFAFTYSIPSFILVVLDLPLCICLALRLAYKASAIKERRLRLYLELLMFCVGFVVAFLVRESVFEPARTLYFHSVKDKLDKYAEEVEQSVQKIELIGIPRELSVPREYFTLVGNASGVRFADGTILIKVRSGNMGSTYLGFVYFEGDESAAVNYLQSAYSWIDLQRMNDHWYKTTHGGMTMEMLNRLPENQ